MTSKRRIIRQRKRKLQDCVAEESMSGKKHKKNKAVKKKFVKSMSATTTKKKETLAQQIFGLLVPNLESSEQIAVSMRDPGLCQDRLADMLFGLDLPSLSQSVVSSRVYFNTGPCNMPSEQQFSFDEGHLIYKNTPGCILSMDTPSYLTAELFGVFDMLPFGGTLVDLASTAGPSSTLLLVKKSSHCIRTFANKKLLIVQLDESATWNGIVLDADNVLFLDRPTTLQVTSKGCSAIIIAFDPVTLGHLTEHALLSEVQLPQGICSLAPRAAKNLSPLALFDSKFTSLLLRLMSEYKRTSCYSLAAPAVRAPLLRNTLHSQISQLEYIQLAASSLSTKNMTLESLKIASDLDTATAAFTTTGVLWSQVPNVGKLVDDTLTSVMRRAATEAKTNDLHMESVIEGEKYFPVHYRQHRQDIGQNVDGGFCEMLLKAVIKEIGPFLHKILGNARLVELSCLVSRPGAMEQPAHSDSIARTLEATSCAHLVSCFVPLVDVTEDMGPLEVWPRTHSIIQLLNNSISLLASSDGNQHQEFMSEKEQLAATEKKPITSPLVFKSNKMTVPKGSVVMMDSRCYHRGSANMSKKIRPVFYFTFASEQGDLPEGSTYSLIDSLKRRNLRLGDLMMLPRPLPAPYRTMKLLEFPSTFKDNLFLHLNDGCAASLISRVKPSSKRSANNDDDINDTYEAIVSAQEKLTADEASANVVAIFNWLKVEAARHRSVRTTKDATGLILNEGVVMTTIEAAKAAYSSGISVVLSARTELRNLLWEAKDSANTRILNDCVDRQAHVFILHDKCHSQVMYNSDYTVLIPLKGSLELTVWSSGHRHNPSNTSIMKPLPKCDGSREVFNGRIGNAVHIPEGCYFQITAADAITAVVATGTYRRPTYPSIQHSTMEVTQRNLRDWHADGWKDFCAIRALKTFNIVPPLVALVTVKKKDKKQRPKQDSAPLVLNPCITLKRIDINDTPALPKIANAKQITECTKHLTSSALSGTTYKLVTTTSQGTHESLLISHGADVLLDRLSLLAARGNWCDAVGLPVPPDLQLDKECGFCSSLLKLGILMEQW
eukprot:TRINITY_DN2602_c0_g1_i2.p2 TRINITY_DN2602_c0_g1~~TRINITY_DN2602_c0_g1_i2.p2  ORF type:complete len:1103 (+),score=152.76 TRINITY_DN2602_c0_g1_i2:132-3311(+)